MTIEQLEAEVLALPKDSQKQLIARLLEHLGKTSEIDPEVSSIWIEEAELRNQAMDKGQVSGIPAEEVFQTVRASLR